MKLSFINKNSITEFSKVQVAPLDEGTNQMVVYLLDQIFHLNFEGFLYLFDISSQFNDLLHSIPLCTRKPLLYKLMQLCVKSSQFERFEVLLQYLFRNVKIVDNEKLNDNNRTLRNILRSNKKIVQDFINHNFDYRPQEVVDDEIVTGKEQIWIPGTETVDNLNKCFTSVESTASNVKIAIDSSTAAIHNLLPKLENATDSVTCIKDLMPHLIQTLDAITQFTNLGKDTIRKLDNHTAVINNVESFSTIIKNSWPAIAACTTGIITSETMPQLLTHVIPLLSILKLDTSLVDQINEFFVRKAHQQDGFSSTKKLFIFLASFLGKYSPISFISKMTSNMNNTVKEMESIDKLLEMFGDVLSEFGFDITSKAKAISDLRVDMVSLIDKTPEFEMLVNSKCVVFIRDAKYNEFMQCYNKVQEIKKQVDTGVYMSIRNSNFCADLMSFNTRYIRMKSTIDAVRATNGRRQEPVAILFHGPPNLGKSQLTCHLRTRIIEMYKQFYADNDDFLFMSDIENWSTWQQNTTDDYHQNYNGNEIHAIDDLFSRSDHLDHKDMLNFISCVVFPTRQAELSEKGKPYVAKLMLASSNLWPTSSLTINCIEALHRRFTVIEFALKPGHTVPTTGFDKTFGFLDMTLYNGKHYNHQNRSAGNGVPVNIDQIANYCINTMRVKYDIFQSAMAASQSDDSEASTSGHVENRVIPSTLEQVVMSPDWNKSIKSMYTKKELWKFLCKVKLPDPTKLREGLFSVSELQLVDPNFCNTRYVMHFLSGHLKSAGYALILKEFDDRAIYFDTHLGRLFYTPQPIPDPPDVEEEISIFDYCFTDQMQLTFLTYYNKIYSSFESIIDVSSRAGGLAMCYMNPVLALATSFISYILVKLCENGTVAGDHILLSVWRVISDLTRVLYLIPFIIGIIGYVFFKCRTFTMTEACTNCALSIDNFSEISEQFCEQNCHHSVHHPLCTDVIQYVSYLLKPMCVACKNDSCVGSCSHSLPIEAIDEKKLTYFKRWVRENLDIDEPDEPFFKKQNVIYFKEEISPKGEKQAKIKRTLRHEESPKGERMIRTKRSMNDRKEEISPKAEKQARIKRTMVHEATDSTSPKFIDKYIMRDWLQTPEELKEEYDFGGHNPGSNERKKIDVHYMTVGVEQQALDPSARDLYSATIKSSVLCKRLNVNGNVSFLYGHPFGKYVVTPAHLHLSASLDAKYFFVTKVNGVEKEIPMTLVAKRVNRDVALWTFVDNTVLFSQRLYNNLITEEEYLKFCNQEIYVLQQLPKMNLTQLVVARAVNHKTIALAGKGLNEYERLFQVQATSTYSPVTTDGDCGGILVAFNTLIKRKIIGFHVIGATDKAFSAILTRDLVDEMIPVVAKEEHSFEIIDQKCSKFPIVDLCAQVNTVVEPSRNMPHGDFEYLGELDFLARPAASTGIKQHPLFGSFEVKHAPANLTTTQVEDKSLLSLDDYGEPNLLVSRTAKYGKEFKNIIDPMILANMQSQLSSYYIDLFKDKDIGISSEYEILNGDPKDLDSHPLDMRTSAGIPWAKTKEGFAHKKDYFTKMLTNEEGVQYRVFDITKPETQALLSTVEETEKLAIKGYRTLSINKDCLKDECRPLDKVHKPRVFKNVPFDKVILLKKYLGKFKTEWTKLRGAMFHSVGINTLSAEWATLYHEMKEKSDKGCDADFGTFDGNLRPEFMDIACSIIRATIAEHNGNDSDIDKIIEILLDENVRSISVSAFTVYMDKHGNPSGSPMTTVMNCMVNFLYHWYCFIRITGNFGLGKFIDNICLRAFGDDVIYTASDQYGYNFASVSKIMIDELEQDYTDATKSVEGATKRIEDLSFLKRRFKIVSPSIIFSPIETDSIEMRFNYTNIEPTDYVTHNELIQEGLLEAAMHGTEYFTKFATAIQRGIRKCHLSRVIRSFHPVYSDYYQMLLNRYQ